MMKKKNMLWLLVVLAALIASCGPSGATPDEAGDLVIIQVDQEGGGMNFSPDSVVLTAGQTVRIILDNQGSKNHEFMMGRNVVYNASGAPDGFEEDFFEGLEVHTELGEGAMLMIDGEIVMMDTPTDEMGDGDGDMEDMDDGEMGESEDDMEGMDEGGDEDMDHMGYMVMNDVGSGRTVIEFTVPEDRVGEWEMACFEDDGAHYEDGMRGTLLVVEP